MTAGDILEERGMQKGFREALLKLLGLRFGALPERVIAQVSAASKAQIDVWLERVLSAPTLADVLEGAGTAAE